MELSNIELSQIVSTTSPLIKSLIESYVIPKLKSLKSKIALDYNSGFIPTEEHFNEYFHRTVKKISVVNTLVFNNSQRSLTDIYLPLTIEGTGEENEKQKITNVPKELIKKYNNILITDTAGMGKSTLMKFIFIDIIKSGFSIPIFIELRRLNKGKTILMEIYEQLNQISEEFNQDLFIKLIEDGGFIFLLDGYDEITLNERDIVTLDIQNFICKANSNYFILTSRPEKSLSSFGNFKEFKIQPLSKKESYELLRKYDKQGSISSLLIKKLQDTEMNNIDEFLTNPLLVSLLFIAFEHKQTIPFKKHLFYRQVYDANFENHDLTKGDSYLHDKHSKLEIDDFHRVLRHLGFSCLKLQKIEFNKDEILKHISESKIYCIGLEFKESDFLDDIIRTVPVFTQDGNYFRWSHKSLQEYFAAQFIYLDSKEIQSEILLKLFNSNNVEKHFNILDIYYDLDYKVFRHTIEFSIIKEYLEHAESILNEYKNIELDKKDLFNRINYSFYSDYYLYNAKDGFQTSNSHRNVFNITREKYQIQTITTISVTNIDKLFVVMHNNPKILILNILKGKRNSLISTVDKFRKISNYDFNFNFENLNEPYKIEINSNENLNSKSNFKKTNELMKEIHFESCFIDFSIAKSRFEEIANETKKTELNNLLLDL